MPRFHWGVNRIYLLQKLQQITMGPMIHFAFPLVELHRHLEMCVRPETLFEIRNEAGLKLPPTLELTREKVLITKPMANLTEVLAAFSLMQHAWANEHLMERLTYEACQDAYAEGIRVLELRYAPTFLSFNQLSFTKTLEAIQRGLEKGRHLGMAIGLIGIIQRTLSDSEAAKVMDFIIANQDYFVGVDLADREEGFPCQRFEKIFLKARKANLRVTIHSGEEDVPRAPQYVRDAIDYLGAERIGHGLQIVKDPKVIEYVKSKDVVLELCPTSNWLTQSVKTIADHPARTLFDLGVKTTLNSDDPAIFNTDLNQEMGIALNTLGFTMDEIKKLTDIAAKASFISPSSIKSALNRPMS